MKQQTNSELEAVPQDRLARSAKILILVIALAAWSFFLWRGIAVFKPGVASLHFYNSDGAIPVLMSNDEQPITPYNLYYYGTDRWGGWPFLVAQAVRRSTGFLWTDQRLSAFQIIWIFLGAFAIGALSRTDRVVIGAFFLFTLCLHGETRYLIFWLSQVYGWQMTALLISWYSMRKLTSCLIAIGKSSARRCAGWLVASFAFSYLAIWSSSASVPFLLFLAAVEICRIRLRDSANQRVLHGWLRSAAAAFGPVFAATALERVQRAVYHSYALKHYGSDFSPTSHFYLDVGNLGQNLATQLQKLISLGWWPLELFAMVAFVVSISVIVYRFATGNGSRSKTIDLLLSDNTFWVALGAAGLALINFLLTVIVAHTRINQYDDRYLTFTAILGPVSGMLFLYQVLKLLTVRTRIARFVAPAVVAAIILALTVKFPAPDFRHEYQTFSDIASALEQKAPHGILLGDYWGTYVFAALQHSQPIIPVPLEGQENRMPWTKELVRNASEVIVEFRRSKLAENGPPPARLEQYGNSFQLVDGDWYQSSVFAFALYQRENTSER